MWISMKENNKGFTLIELVITLAIVAILSLAAFSFAIVSSRTYQKQTKDVEVQYESQLAMNQIQELLIDAGKAVSYSYDSVSPGTAAVIDTNMLESDSSVPTAAATKELAIYNKDKYYVIQWVKADERLYYYEYKYTPSGFTISADKVRMADYVQSFSVDLSNVDQTGSVALDAVFRKDKDYQVTQNVRIRNKVEVNKSLVDIYS